jgi:hypothetical protein
MYIRFRARVSVNNRSEAISAYCLTFQGRAEMRSKGYGHSRHTPDVQRETGLADDNVNIKTCMKHGQCYDDVMAKLADIILNTEPMLNDDECAAPTCGAKFQVLEDDAEDTESTPEVVRAENYKTCLTQFASMADGDLLAFDPYHDMYPLASQCIRRTVSKAHLGRSQMIEQFDKWLFHSASHVSFMRDGNFIDDPNSNWQTAHRLEDWQSFSELALRFVTCGTFEADAERILSMQRNVAGLHGAIWIVLDGGSPPRMGHSYDGR